MGGIGGGGGPCGALGIQVLTVLVDNMTVGSEIEMVGDDDEPSA